MKKRIILILLALALFVSCEEEIEPADRMEISNPPEIVQEQTHEDFTEKSITDEKDNFTSEESEEMLIEEEDIELAENEKDLPESQRDDGMFQETLAMEKGLSFQNDNSLLAVMPINSEEFFSLAELDFPIKDFRLLFFTTMDEGETEDFLLIPRYVGTTIRLYESGDEDGLPIYSYALDKKDVVVLRIGADQEDFDYRIVVSYEGQEATWMLSEEREGEKLPLEEGFEQIDKKQG